MNWIPLSTEAQLQELIARSAERPQVIFKHSIRCSISAMVKGRLDREKQPSTLDFHYLDLINYRALSNKVAEEFGVQHESPQLLVISHGKSIYDESHNGISMAELADLEIV